jgi:hypothetical protein
VQTGSVVRHGRGWRGYWREGGKRRATETHAKKGEAREALNRELDRMRQGAAYRPPITLRKLSGRFLEQYIAAPRTVTAARQRLRRPLDAFGDVQAVT